jgi:catechol 2,3-dioxygenase-like lactoylglutathione lyase family enzyme
MFTPLGLDHVVLRVRDQAASQRFYVDVLGCTVARVNERISLIHLRFGDQLIDLLPATAAPPESAGMDHFCLSIECDDLGKVADELRRRGVALDGEVSDRFGAYGRGPSLYVRDPDGYRVELKPRQPTTK